MKKLVLMLVAVCALSLPGCNSVIGQKAAEGHQAVFGCWPKGYTPPRVLDAEGPKDEVKRDFLGNECGKPVYKRPACSEKATCTTPDCLPPK